MDWHDWWLWELEFTPHLMKRMVDRIFSDVDVRLMLDAANGFYENHEDGRFVIDTTHDRRRWAVIVEPSAHDAVLIVVPAYPID